MRRRPVATPPPAAEEWRGSESIQWGCVLLELLGEPSLEHLPLLLSGSRAPETALHLPQQVAAVRRARALIGEMPTRRAVERAVRQLFQNAQAARPAYDPAFSIDPATLIFRRQPGHNARIDAARAHLLLPAQRRPRKQQYAEPGDRIVRLREPDGPQIPLRLPALNLPPVRQHTLQRETGRPELRVTMADLARTADRLDLADRLARQQGDPRRPENWRTRLDGIIRLQACHPAGLTDTDVLDLTGLKHLLGLPGAGKTTLISLLCAFLASEGRRVAVFFTSIETAREYLEKLTRYGVSTALLIGSSAETHRRHADRLAELIATEGHQGFGEIRAGADLLAQTCPLPAFAVHEAAAWEHWGPTVAPCTSLYDDRDAKQARLCPLWSSCGRVKNQRELATAQVWLGHVRSADTAVPAHTSPEQLQYFELLADTFDLVIFDEVDETQRVLDNLGALTLELSGKESSIHLQAQRVTAQALSGALPRGTNGQLDQYHFAANAFERHLLRFVQELRLLDSDQQHRPLESRLLTTNYLIRLACETTRQSISGEQRSALYTLWDSALYASFYRGDDERISVQPTNLAPLLDWSEDEAQQRWGQLKAAFDQYQDALNYHDTQEPEMQALSALFAGLIAPAKAAKLAPLARVLVAVGFTVAAYQRLARLGRPLAQYGLLPEELLTTSAASKTLRQQVPRSLLGIFSSVRYRRRSDGKTGFELDYLVLDSTPRLLLHRLHERGTHVLLASATSWLPASSAYHVGVAPAYVLRPRQHADTRLTLRFSPVRPAGHIGALRFSGAGYRRDENLRLMTEHLAAESPLLGMSLLELAARAKATPAGRWRKCALVVNSYEQVQQVVETIAALNPPLAARTVGVVKRLPARQRDQHYVLRGQVETLGHDEETVVVVFPLQAMGRGVNIVFSTNDDDDGAAALGTVYFLIRPHPTAGDLTLMLSSIARATEEFDRQRFDGQDLASVAHAQQQQRRQLHAATMQLLARPQQASLLPEAFRRPFGANLLIPILQTIGRAIRKSQPAEVVFVDAAWAPHSADEQPDDEKSSVLVAMRNLLHDYVNHPDPGQQAILTALYGPFATAFANINGLLTTGEASAPNIDEDEDRGGHDDFGEQMY